MQKKYRVAVIGRTGRGNYGHGIDTVWLEVPETEIVGVADDSKPGLAAAAKRLKVDAAFTDYRELLDKTKPDIVAVCPRWIEQHAEMTVAAAERGCHIYSEKPFCRTAAEADRIVNACEATHVKFAIAHQTRYSPKFDVAQELIAAGKLGQILEFRGRGKEDRRGGGEDLWVLGTHIFDLIRGLGGDAEYCFARVTQNGQPITLADVAPGPEGIGPLAGDHVRAMYGMKSGATAYFGSKRSASGNPSRFGLTIYGTAGVLELHTGFLPPMKYLDDPSWTPGRTGKAWQDVSSNGIGKPETMQDGGLHAGNVLAVRELLAAIENNDQPRTNVYEARAVTEMILGVFASQQQGGPVKLPLEKRSHPLES